jgi:hypothetical protein
MKIEIDDDLVAVFRLRFPDVSPERAMNDFLRCGREGEIEKIRSELRSNGVGSIVLVEIGTNKISAIKLVRELTGMGLKEAKDIVDGVSSPAYTSSGYSYAAVVGKPYTFNDSMLGGGYSMEQAAKRFREIGCVIRFNMDPSDIAAVRNKYGVYGPEILKGLVSNTDNV